MVKDEKTILDAEETVLDTEAADATLPDDNDATMLDDATVLDGEAASDDKNGTPVIEKGAFLLDTYRIESDAIEGGMGAVWRVHHTGWNVDLAMKRPKAGMFQTEKQKENFIRECDAWINLGLHPHIVSCYYVRRIGDTPTIFSEWMDGGSLKNTINDGRLYEGNAAERILDIAIQFARGLHYAHEQGLVHQDVKPDNLLLTKAWDAKVADFGIARARATLTVLDADIPADATMFSASGGYTPAYCSMEQLNGGQLTRRTDIYSWAVSVMEMYLGDRPWQNGVIAGAACEEYFPDAKVPIPQKMQDLLKACLNAKEDERPHDFTEVESRLLEIYREETGADYPRPVSKAAANTADSLNNRALSFLDMGLEDDADMYWRRALELDADHVQSAYNHALWTWRNAAITDLEALQRIEALKGKSEAVPVNLAIAMLQIERSDGDCALAVLNEITEEAAGIDAVQKARESAQRIERNGKLLHSIPGIACLTNDGAHVLSAVQSNDFGQSAILRLLDAHTMDCIREFECADGLHTIGRLTFSPDDRYALASRPVNLETVRKPADPRKHFAPFDTAPAPSHTDPMQAALGIWMWETETGKLIRYFDLTDEKIQVEDKPNRSRQAVSFHMSYNNQYICVVIDEHSSISLRSSRVILLETATGRCVRNEHNYGGDYRFSSDSQILFLKHSPDIVYQISIEEPEKEFFYFKLPAGLTPEVFFRVPGRRSIYMATREGALLCRDLDDTESLHYAQLCEERIHIPFSIPPFKVTDNIKLKTKRGGGSANRIFTGIMLLCGNDRVMRTMCAQKGLYSSSRDESLLLINNGGALLYEYPSFNEKANWLLCRIETAQKRLDYDAQFEAAKAALAVCVENGDITGACAQLTAARSVPGFESHFETLELGALTGRYCLPESVRVCKEINRTPRVPDDLRLDWTSMSRYDGLLAYTVDGKRHAISLYTNPPRKGDFEVTEIQEYSDAACPNRRYFYRCAQLNTVIKRKVRKPGPINLYEDKTIRQSDKPRRSMIWLVDGREDKVVFSREKQGDMRMRGADFSPDGKTLAFLNFDGKLELYDLEKADTIREFALSRDVGDIYFENDGKHILAFCGDLLRLDIQTGNYDVIATQPMEQEPIIFRERFELRRNADNGGVFLQDKKAGTPVELTGGRRFCGTLEHTNNAVLFSTNGQWLIVENRMGYRSLCIYRLDWEYSFPGWTSWDEGARPRLEAFLTRHPTWTDADFDSLIAGLQDCGYGWLQPDGVRAKLEELSPKGKGFFSLFGKKK